MSNKHVGGLHVTWEWPGEEPDEVFVGRVRYVRAPAAMTEADLASLTDQQLLDLHRQMEPGDPLLDLVLGEIERRGLDI